MAGMRVSICSGEGRLVEWWCQCRGNKKANQQQELTKQAHFVSNVNDGCVKNRKTSVSQGYFLY